MCTSCALNREFQTVSFNLFSVSAWTTMIMSCTISTDVRGQPQEVQVNVKKGVETKSYEGVSMRLSLNFHLLIN